jgi:hypothetical protein
MKTLFSKLFFLLITISVIVIACDKEEDTNNNNNNNNTDPCTAVPCKNSSTCNEGVCQCPAEWTGKYCDTSAVLTPFYDNYRIVSTNNCRFGTLDVQFHQIENNPNPNNCYLLFSIRCDNVDLDATRVVATFDGNNFTTSSVSCVYNNIVQASYSASGYFTTDSVYVTLNSTVLNEAPETCTYKGLR